MFEYLPRILALPSGLLLVPSVTWAHPDPAVHVHPDGSVLLAVGLAVLGWLAIRRIRSRTS